MKGLKKTLKVIFKHQYQHGAWDNNKDLIQSFFKDTCNALKMSTGIAKSREKLWTPVFLKSILGNYIKH